MNNIEQTTASSEAIEAATFRRLINHLQNHPEAQNIDLMILANFCRNCLSKWYREEAESRGVEISDADSRALVYGMPYPDWKALHQTPASPEQLAALSKRNQ